MRIRHNIIARVVLAAVLAVGGMAVSHALPAHRDSTMLSTTTEMDGLMMRRMVQSAYPVEITMRGNAVCVRSKYSQLLPVYTQSGAFYAAFRLNKGTNWLSGLPRGTYYINNHRIIVS